MQESGNTRFVVTYADDHPCPFSEGTRRRFGRDDAEDVLTIWEQIRSMTLSSIAGELWCTGDQMWVRNLSGAHELVVQGPGTTPVVLPARSSGPGHACSIPWPTGTVRAPSTGSWHLTVVALDAPVGAREALDDSGALDDSEVIDLRDLERRTPAVSSRTVRVPDVPDRFRSVAASLCNPLLTGGSNAATYAEAAAELGCTSRVARRRVEELVEFYSEYVRLLPGAQRVDETMTSAVARLLVQRGKLAARAATSAPGTRS